MLSPREQKVAELIIQYKTNKEIASVLHVSERTVKFHVTGLLRRLGVTSRAMITQERIDHWTARAKQESDLDRIRQGYGLSSLELSVSKMLAEGLRQDEIAIMLGRTVNQIQYCCDKLRAKFGVVRSRDLPQAIASSPSVEERQFAMLLEQAYIRSLLCQNQTNQNPPSLSTFHQPHTSGRRSHSLRSRFWRRR